LNGADQDLRWLKREWLAACLAVGLGLAGSIGAFALLDLKPVARGAESASSQNPPADRTAAPPAAAETPAQQFCSTTVSIAQDFGIVSQGARAASGPQKTDVKGRYVCVADGGKYTISVDLLCRDLSDEHCFDIYSVTQSDGTVLFQRQG
jgi:hypothetical protein